MWKWRCWVKLSTLYLVQVELWVLQTYILLSLRNIHLEVMLIDVADCGDHQQGKIILKHESCYDMWRRVIQSGTKWHKLAQSIVKVDLIYANSESTLADGKYFQMKRSLTFTADEVKDKNQHLLLSILCNLWSGYIINQNKWKIHKVNINLIVIKKCIGICFCTEKCVNSLNPICCGNLDWGGHKARVGGDTG